MSKTNHTMPIRHTQHTYNCQEGAQERNQIKIKIKNHQFFYYHTSRVSAHKKKVPTINNKRHRISRTSEFFLSEFEFEIQSLAIADLDYCWREHKMLYHEGWWSFACWCICSPENLGTLKKSLE